MSKAGMVLKIVADLTPGRMAGCSGSAYVLELPAGTATATGTMVNEDITTNSKYFCTINSLKKIKT